MRGEKRIRLGEDAERDGEAREVPDTMDGIDTVLNGLNPCQREAALHGEGPLLVLAVAGSGKTRAIAHRVAWLIAGRDIPPSEILCLTFTNKAAGEMRERVASLLGGGETGRWSPPSTPSAQGSSGPTIALLNGAAGSRSTMKRMPRR